MSQTLKTCESIREKLPDADIMICECSPLTPDENEVFEKIADFFVNLHGTKWEAGTRSHSKAAGEGAQTIAAAGIIENSGMAKQYSKIMKISGRYWLNDNFKPELWNDKNTDTETNKNKNVANVPSASSPTPCTSTVLYQLSTEAFLEFAKYLDTHTSDINACVAFETLFHRFFYQSPCCIPSNLVSSLGVSGFCAVDGTPYTN